MVKDEYRVGHETKRYKRQAVIMGISSPGGQIGSQTNGSLTSASIIDHLWLLSWLWLAETSSNQFLPVVVHAK